MANTIRHKTAEAWDEQYRSGDWNYLKSVEQVPRYATIAGWIKSLINPQCSVLDIGCGEGLLLEWLTAEIHYDGVDVSAVAIEKARTNYLTAQRTFHCTSGEDFLQLCDTKFDCVVFNEVLYCCVAPFRLLASYERLLKAGGYLFLSVTGFEPEFWNDIRRFYGNRFAVCLRIEDCHLGKSWNLAAIASDR